MHCTRIQKFDVIFSLATTPGTQRKGMKKPSAALRSQRLCRSAKYVAVLMNS